MTDLQAAPDAFTVTTDEATGFHHVVNTSTGEILPRAYPLKKTANRAARQMGAQAHIIGVTWNPAQADEPTIIATFTINVPGDDDEAPVSFPGLYVEPTQVDVEDRAPTIQPEAPKAPAIRHAVADTIATREDWLNAAAVHIGSTLSMRADLELPSYRVTCGWPSKGGTAKKRVLGQCWNPDASEDAHAEVFISPMEADALTIVQILAHELIHACLPKGTGHKGPFIKAAKAVGFLAPFTQLKPSDDLAEWTQAIVDLLPAYPHARINPGAEGDKKTQTTRMIKAVCLEVWEGDDCGYQVRLTRKWIDTVGAPICPRCDATMTCEGVEPAAGDEPEGGDE